MHRSLRSIAQAPLQPQFWKLYWQVARHFEKPASVAWRYTVGRGVPPRAVTVRTPVGPVTVELASVDDLVTLVECFAKVDYPVHGTERLVVDFGANIGLSTLYFLTHAPHATVHLFEPVPANLERLRRNLRGYEDRFIVHPVAVATEQGAVRFGVEPTGRYGGIDADLPESIEVPSVDAAVELRRLSADHGAIDLLKLDIEGLEATVIRHLHAQGVLSQVGRIYAELPDDDVDLPGWRRSRQGWVTRFEALRTS